MSLPIKRVIAVMCLLLLGARGALAEPGGNASDSYMYNRRGQTVESIDFYQVETQFSGETLGVGSLAKASELYIRDNLGYIVDTQRNRIIAIDLDALAVREIVEGFDNAGVREGFNLPQSVFVTAEGDMYVADTQNLRIVHLDAARSLVKIIDKPQAEIIAGDYMFKPRKVAVDTGGRVYVVAEGTTDGILQFSSAGRFINFFGANRVQFNAGELLLRLFLTKEQRGKRSVFVPIEYSNICIDSSNFIFTTTVNTFNEQLKRLNYAGTNIMRYSHFGARMGDLSATEMPYMTDIAVDENGSFTGLDSLRGKLYQYNKLGELLAIYGGFGDRLGQFRQPVAVDVYKGRYYVLDGLKASVTVFAPTTFGQNVLTANQAFFDGDYELSRRSWEAVLAQNANYDLAYQGMGDACMKEKQYARAMDYYRRAAYKKGYTQALKAYRTQWMRANFAWIVSGIVLLAAVLILTVKRRARLGQRLRLYFRIDA